MRAMKGKVISNLVVRFFYAYKPVSVLRTWAQRSLLMLFAFLEENYLFGLMDLAQR